MALKKNKVKFGLNKVHWAKITAWSDDGVSTFATPVRLPGAVSLSIDANGENDNFYADNTVYYVINNNAGYEGDLEVALITTDFATAILGEVLDSKGVTGGWKGIVNTIRSALNDIKTVVMTTWR